MRTTITVRLPEHLVAWLEEVSRLTGLSRGELIRSELERARDAAPSPKRYMRHAGAVRGAKDLSQRKGFSRT